MYIMHIILLNKIILKKKENNVHGTAQSLFRKIYSSLVIFENFNYIAILPFTLRECINLIVSRFCSLTNKIDVLSERQEKEEGDSTNVR